VNDTLDALIVEIAGAIPSLRAAVLSAAPDGLIAWCWARDGASEIALSFAHLDRVATACLEQLGASREARSMLLNAKDASIVAWPIGEVDASAGTRLILTVVFEGELQAGMVMVYAQRVLVRIRAALAELRERDAPTLRERLVDWLCTVEDPVEALEQLAAAASLDPDRITRLDVLDDDERRRLGDELERHNLARIPPSILEQAANAT
jgi:hypothetical protein